MIFFVVVTRPAILYDVFCIFRELPREIYECSGFIAVLLNIQTQKNSDVGVREFAILLMFNVHCLALELLLLPIQKKKKEYRKNHSMPM